MLQLANAYHTGFVVPDVEAAMAELSRVFGVEWTDVEDRRVKVLTPEGPVVGRLRFVYTRGDAPHLELLEPVPGTVWDRPLEATSGLGAAHHVGVWAEDFVATSDRLVEAGFPRLLTFDDGSGRPVGFAYHRLPSGVLVELVDAARRGELEAWLRGGAYPAGRQAVATGDDHG